MAEKKIAEKKIEAKKIETKIEAKKIEIKTEKRVRANDNEIFVGQKPTMNYVLAVITQFGAGVKEVHIKSRGRAISRAVDVAEVVRNKFMTDVKVKNIEIRTEEREVEGGNKINVSSMNIILTK